MIGKNEKCRPIENYLAYLLGRQAQQPTKAKEKGKQLG